MPDLTKWFRTVLYFPLTRMVIAFIAIVASVAIESIVLESVGKSSGFWSQNWYTVLRGAIVIATACLVYRGYVRFLEHRPTLELSGNRALSEFAIGAAMGFALITATIACLWLGGYYHVDGLGEVLSIESEGGSHRVRVRVPKPLHRYIAPKGSITVEGVSLTVNEVDDETFSVLVIPHTLRVTTLGALAAGDAVNIEVDLMARYAARLLQKR